MLNTLLIVFISLIILQVIIYFSIRYFHLLSWKIVGEKHKLIEYIITTSQVPEDWLKKYRVRTKRIVEEKVDKKNMGILSGEAFVEYLHRLDQLINYIKTTSIVESEEVRKIVLIRLKEVRKEWVKRKDILDYNV